MKYKNRFLMCIIFIVIVICVISINNSFDNIVFAIGDSMRGEVGPMPSQTQQDDPTTPVIPEVEVEKKITKNYIYYNSISGNVYEQIHETTGKTIDYNDNPKIQYIKVEAIRQDGFKYTVHTDENGNYSFSNMEAGKYKLVFTFGEPSEDENAIKNNLKYNGIDYTAYAAGSVKNNYTIIENTILKSGKGATEIILALDCSVSATYTKLNTGLTRLETQKEAAKKLIESLLDQKNIYIGIICFAGNGSAYRAISQTDNKDLLIQTLDEIRIGGKCSFEKLPGGTNLVEALNKSNNSFVGKSSNKWIILLSDGAPTSDGKIQVYNDDTDEDFLYKLKQISNTTKNELKKLSDNKIKICSFIIDSEDDLENNLVKKIFQNNTSLKYFHSSDENATNVIKQDIFDFIINNNIEKENILNEEEILNFDGLDDIDRRQEVNKRFKKYDFKISSEIEELISNYDISKKERAKELLQNSYINVTVNKEYIIDNIKNQDSNYWYFEDAGKIAKKNYTDIECKGYINQNLELRQRERLNLQLEVKVTGYRLTLPNGMIYNTLTTDGTIDSNLKKDEVIKNVKDIRDSVFVESIDKELLYGSKVDIEYTLVLKNISSVPVSNVTLIDYLADFTGNDLQVLDYDKDAKMITNQHINSEYGWKLVKKDDLKDLVSENTFNNMHNGYYITMNTSDSNLIRKQKNIGAKGERYIKIVLSKVLSTNTKNDNTEFTNTAEILNYTNSLGIRMKNIYKDQNNLDVKKAVISGNSIQGINSELDYAKSIKIIVIPPTGKKINIIIASVTFIMFLIIVFITNTGKIRLRKKNNNE